MAYVLNPFTGSLVPLPNTTEALSAKTLVIERIASENISALKIVYLNSTTTCAKSDNSSHSSATSCGIAINAGNIGDTIKILSFGVVEDSSFIFGINEPIYLSVDGEITATPPSSGYLVKIGYGLGSGAIFIKIEKPIAL